MYLEVESEKQQDIVDKFGGLFEELKSPNHHAEISLKRDERGVYRLESCVSKSRDPELD
jgi:hypothetical protein